MTRRALQFTVSCALVAVVVAVAGSTMVARESREAVWVGAASGGGLQIAAFWLLFVWAFPHRPLLAYGLGMLARFGMFAIMALVWAPLAGLPLAPALFSMVTVLFVTTLLEPLLLRRELARAPHGGATPSPTTR